MFCSMYAFRPTTTIVLVVECWSHGKVTGPHTTIYNLCLEKKGLARSDFVANAIDRGDSIQAH